MESRLLPQLVTAVRKGPVFGEASFAGCPPTPVVMKQMGAVAQGLDVAMVDMLAPGTPELSREEVHGNVASFLAKCVGFCSLVAGGELDDIEGLRVAAQNVGVGYWADGILDEEVYKGRRGGNMAMAIRHVNGRSAAVPAARAAAVEAQCSVLLRTHELAGRLALPADVSTDQKYVIYVGNEESLAAQLEVRRLSAQYESIPRAVDRQAFLSGRARIIARHLLGGAGVSCAATPIYALFRRHDPGLPDLETIYNTPELEDLRWVGNGLVRACDDKGDWRDDKGSGQQEQDADRNMTLNLFNQSHPAVIRAFCDKIKIGRPETVDALVDAFGGFHESDQARRERGAFITTIIRDHVREQFGDIPGPIRRRFARYILLLQRTLEGAWVNQLGDQALREP